MAPEYTAESGSQRLPVAAQTQSRDGLRRQSPANEVKVDRHVYMLGVQPFKKNFVVHEHKMDYGR